MRGPYAALFGAASLLCAVLASASPSGSPPVLGGSPLQQAMQSIWLSSPEVDAARAQLDAARARARAAAQPLYNPSVALEAENADVNRRTAALSLALDLSGKRRARAAQGDAGLRVAEAGYDLVRRDIATRWLKAWAGAMLAARQSDLGTRRVALMRRFDELATKRLGVGDISSPERDLAGLALGEAQMQQATLTSNQAGAQAALLAISGERLANMPDLPARTPPPATAVTPLSSDDLPAIVQARAQQSSAEAGEQVARRNRIPDPTVSLTGGRVSAGQMNDRVIGVSVSIPLPVLNTGRAEVDAARADVAAAAADLRSRQFLARAVLQEALARYVAMRQASEAFHAGRAGAFEDRTAMLEKLWQAGEISTSDYLVQLKQSLDTALSGIELETQTWQAWFDYLNAAGRLTDWLDGNLKDPSP